MDGSLPKTGAYPTADRAALFGTLFLEYFDKMSDDSARLKAYEGMLALVYPKGRHDAEFMDVYESLATKKSTWEEKLRMVMEMTRLMDDLGTWDERRPWGEAVLDGEDEQHEEPVAAVHSDAQA